MAEWRVVVGQSAAERPLVVVLEDVHRAGDRLLDFVDTVVPAMGPVPLLVVVTAVPRLLATRPCWGGGKYHAATITLDRPPKKRDGTELDARYFGA
jgi:predicted ATPase